MASLCHTKKHNKGTGSLRTSCSDGEIADSIQPATFGAVVIEWMRDLYVRPLVTGRNGTGVTPSRDSNSDTRTPNNVHSFRWTVTKFVEKYWHLHVINVCTESKGLSPYIRDECMHIKWMLVVNFKLLLLYLRGKKPECLLESTLDGSHSAYASGDQTGNWTSDIQPTSSVLTYWASPCFHFTSTAPIEKPMKRLPES